MALTAKDTADIRRVIALRGYAKASLTRLRSFTLDPAFNQATLESLTVKSERCRQAFKDYIAHSADIAALEPCEKDDRDMEAIESSYYEILSTLNSRMGQLKSDSPATCENDSKVKLPNINIPSFSGNYSEYKSFQSLFNAMIGNDCNISRVQKLYYLHSFLKGEPLELIKNLPLVEESYPEAIKIINERYDNKIKITFDHISQLLDVPHLNKCTTANLRNFISVCKQNLAALKNLGEPVQHWDRIIVCILSRKLDSYTNRSFQLERKSDQLPTISELFDFLEKRATALENTEVPSKGRLVANVIYNNIKCAFCSEGHKIFNCNKFKLLSLQERLKLVKEKKLCNICLAFHTKKCKYHFKCAICKKEHNTLLHEEASSCTSLYTNSHDMQVILPTASVKLYTLRGQTLNVRALFDSGSQVSFVSSEVADLLGIDPTYKPINIMGINSNKDVQNYINLDIHSLNSPFKINVDCHIVDRIASSFPHKKYNIRSLKDLNLPDGGKLADKCLYLSDKIHILLGANIFFQVLLPHQQIKKGDLTLINTLFGYIVSGKVPSYINQRLTSFFCHTCENDINESLLQFWKTEDVPQMLNENIDEHFNCENIFKNTVNYNNNTFSVALPLKIPLESINKILGNSLNYAISRFLNLEVRFKKDPSLFKNYKAFIDEYLLLKHGEYFDLNNYDFSKDPIYFLPHHPIIRNDKLTTKLRIVFDGSMKTNNKISLNDLLLNGPVVQKDLFEILIAFRLHKYIIVTDIKHMFRNVLVQNQYRSLTNILWRNSPSENIKCIRLNTITYGLKGSSYLATQCLIQLADDFADKYPLASKILKNNTYVDDILYSNDSMVEINKAKHELINLLSLGSFQLHKWASNCPQILQDIPTNKQQSKEIDLQINTSKLKTLGILYNTNEDSFKIYCSEKFTSKIHTKREILSYISKFYDPLGLLGPIFVSAKVIMQQLWLAKIDWDTQIPNNIYNDWIQFITSLNNMNPICVQRNVSSDMISTIHLIGFADAASKTAYGCCLYLRIIDTKGNTFMKLLCSKSRINPVRKPLSIPRLELNAALLLAKLTIKIQSILKLHYKLDNTYLFADSKVVLAWLKTDILKLNTYVANRVKVICELTDSKIWHYVNTHDNPADLISRGLEPSKLESCTLWWNGPTFLQNKNYNFDTPIPTLSSLPELKSTVNKNICFLSNKNSLDFFLFLEKYSNIHKMIRIVAYILRFCNNIKSNTTKNKNIYLTCDEINKAKQLIIKNEQYKYFKNEILSIKSNKKIKGFLSNLNPFLDTNNLLRVGGRLGNAAISYSKKYPILLPKESHITQLIILSEHIRLLHAGPRLVLSSLNNHYWITNGLNQVKKIIHKCITCFKLKAEAQQQLMGNLPADRVNVARPFSKIGMDFAGPIQVKNSRVRNSVIGNGYIVVFVCFVTKAIHLELVSDMTTATFLASFKRFIARRNLPTDVYCDNAATFKGARNQLHELYKLKNSHAHQSSVINYSSQLGINFHFIPSYSPVFGGLWEAGVKSTKFLLKRTVGKNLLTYEELNTVLNEIEAVLNSRPITQLSTDVNDYSYLTPGHFLTGSPLASLPERDVSSVPISRLRLWNICTNMRQCFWKTWSKQYLQLLQSRPKWRKNMPNVQPGSLVILREDNTTPLYWPMARIIRTIPGNDGKVRAVEVRSANNHTHIRSINKISILPIEST